MKVKVTVRWTEENLYEGTFVTDVPDDMSDDDIEQMLVDDDAQHWFSYHLNQAYGYKVDATCHQETRDRQLQGITINRPDIT